MGYILDEEAILAELDELKKVKASNLDESIRLLKRTSAVRVAVANLLFVKRVVRAAIAVLIGAVFFTCLFALLEVYAGGGWIQ